MGLLFEIAEFPRFVCSSELNFKHSADGMKFLAYLRIMVTKEIIQKFPDAMIGLSKN